MTNTKNGLILGFIIIFGVFLGISHSGCNPIDQRYYTHLDTLENKLMETGQFLSIDVSTISIREQVIFDHMRYIDMFYEGDMPKEFGNSLAKYKGIKKAYKHFLSQYASIFNEMKSLEIQVQNLRQSVDNQELTKEEFKKYYTTELADIEANRLAAEQLAHSIHSLEPEYQRISRTMMTTLDRLAESNDRLREILDNYNSEPDTTN
ncbi:MAG: hypothetical protein JJ975_03590 [Bacteroidia bacterium]|nr:hypothetical protein [Bacteroidia bacterium]